VTKRALGGAFLHFALSLKQSKSKRATWTQKTQGRQSVSF